MSLPQHRHHFETEEQQREAGTFGMWLFLLTEIMFFGGLFFSYLLYRNWYYDAFAVASNQLSIPLGASQHCHPHHLGILYGARRLGVRGPEEGPAGYLPAAHHALRLRLHRDQGRRVPREVGEAPYSGRSTSMSPSSSIPMLMVLNEKPLAPDLAKKTQIFFSLYFAMTGMHALHMIIGLVHSGLAYRTSSSRRFHSGVCCANRKFRLVLALCRYCLAVPVSLALPHQPASTARRCARSHLP